MPPDTPVSDPNNPVLSSELYNLILRSATLPVLLLLIALSYWIISWLMNPENRQKRRNREIRRAVAAREARKEAAEREKAATEETKHSPS